MQRHWHWHFSSLNKHTYVSDLTLLHSQQLQSTQRTIFLCHFFFCRFFSFSIFIWRCSSLYTTHGHRLNRTAPTNEKNKVLLIILKLIKNIHKIYRILLRMQCAPWDSNNNDNDNARNERRRPDNRTDGNSTYIGKHKHTHSREPKTHQCIFIFSFLFVFRLCTHRANVDHGVQWVDARDSLKS